MEEALLNQGLLWPHTLMVTFSWGTSMTWLPTTYINKDHWEIGPSLEGEGVSSVKYLHMALEAMYLNTYHYQQFCILTSFNYVQVDTIVAGGSFTIWTHCIVIAWESLDDPHNLLTFTLSLHILLQSHRG